MARWLSVGILLASFWLAVATTTRNAPTFDEQGFLVRGLGYLRGNNQHMRVGHPLGLNAWNAMLLVGDNTVSLPTEDPSWPKKSFHRPAELFLWEIGNRVEPIMFLGRIQTVWLILILAAVGFRWVVDLTENRLLAFLALALIALDPNIIAHGSLTTTDMGITACALISAYLMWRYWQRPSVATAVVAGLGFALLNNTKFTAGIFVICFALIIGLGALLEWQGRRPLRALWQKHHRLVWLFPLSGFLFLWGMYGFQISTLPAELPMGSQLSGWTLPLAHHLEQLLDIGNRSTQGSKAFLLGDYSSDGWWYYFPIAFALKTPLPTLILIAAGLPLMAYHGALRADRRKNSGLLWLMVPPLGFFGFSLLTSVNIGYRHILPVIPFLIVWGAVGLAKVAPRAMQWGASAALALWIGVVSLAIAPHQLSFFNLLAGGPDQGWRYLVDSNIDWGQDLTGVTQAAESPIYLSYFGEARPDYYGIDYVGLDSVPPRLMLPWANPLLPEAPAEGFYVVSATNLQGVLFEDRDQFAFFREREPDMKFGYSLFGYQIEGFGDPVEVALIGGLQLTEIPELIWKGWESNRFTTRWAGGETGWVIPIEPALVFAPADRIDRSPACLVWTPAVDWSGVMQGDGSACRVEGQPLAEFEHQSGRLMLGEINVSTDGSSARLDSTLINTGDSRPVKLFIHLENDAGEIIAQWDGFDVVGQGWKSGDLILHSHEIEIDDPATISAIYLGLYDPDTGVRWTTADGQDRFLVEGGR